MTDSVLTRIVEKGFECDVNLWNSVDVNLEVEIESKLKIYLKLGSNP